MSLLTVLQRLVSRTGIICALAVLGGIAAQAQDLPLDNSSMDQLTPEQRERALQLLGQDSGSQDTYVPQRPAPYIQGTRQQRPSDDASPYASERSRRFSSDSGGVGDSGYLPSTADLLRSRLDNERRPGQLGGLKPFGYEIFSGEPSTFTPVTDIPIPTDYVLGPGDVVRVQLFGGQNANYSLIVNRDGRINFPRLGPIDVAGQHFDDIRTLLEDRVGREMIGVQASITLGQLRSIRVFVLGDVNNPGSYQVSSLSTITNALLASGGVSPVGSLRHIELKRDGRTVQVLDLYDLLLHGESSGDVRLLPGDSIFIPPVGPRVSVDGEVKRPAIYELKNEASVGQMFALAGGLMGSTNTSTAQVERFDKNQKRILLQLNMESETALASKVQDGDIVRVLRVSGPLDNNVRAIGAVRYPGTFEWYAGYTLQKLLAAAQLLPSQSGHETYTPIGLIERTDPGSGVRNFVSFNVQSEIDGNVAPLPLQRDDLVIVFNRNDINYLDSPEVHEIVSGDTDRASECSGLQELSNVLNSERADRLLRAFNGEGQRAAGPSVITKDSNQQNGHQQPGIDQRPPSDTQRTIDAGPTLARTTTESAQTTQDNYANASGSGANANSAVSNVRQPQSRSQLSPTTRRAACPLIYQQVPRALPFLLEQSAAVYGEIRQPGIYPIAENTPIEQLVRSAGGLSAESDPHNIEYVSYDEALKSGGSRYQTLDLQGEGLKIHINPGDTFKFKPIYLGQELGSVRASGEFKFPGSYGILKGERLSKLMERAGGLTSTAYPYGAVFTRESARKAEAESYKRASADLQQAMVTAVSSGALGTNATNATPILTTLVDRLDNAIPVGRIVIEADPVVLAAKPDLDPILEPGDLIVMPKRPISVTVIGQVLNPTSVAFTPGLSVRQYIERAGGYSQGADTGRVFVILPNGSAQRFKSSFWNYEPHEIPPGSEIVVPRDAVPFNAFAFSERIFAILSNLAVSAASLAVIARN